MLIVTTTIFINQVPSSAFPTRSYQFELDFVCELEANDSWRDFTNECKITLPKHFGYTDTTGNIVLHPENSTVNLGGFLQNTPLFLKGDEVTVITGYKYKLGNQYYTDTAIIFEGFITKVSSKKPFVLECEDNMFKLKQLPAPNKLFLGTQYTLETMLQELVTPLGFIVNQTAQTNIGDFGTLNETVMDVVARLRKDYHFEAYFIGNQLYCGAFVVYLNPGNNYQFVFQNNIIDDELEYSRKDDIVLSALAYSVNKVNVNAVTKDGAAKTKHQRLEVLVTYQNGVFTSKINPPGQKADFPPNYTGERRTLYFWNVTDPNKLVALAQSELIKYYYTGFKGKFTTFGVPFVKQGDNAEIYDTILPERNGTYKVKSVEYKLSVDGGLRQVIELDYRIGNNIDPMPKLN
jgi:hypothetical protein